MSETSYSQIKDSIPIDSFLEKSGITLKRSGTQLVCCCPLHEERSPSFYVSLQKQSWMCHGCNTGGDVIVLAEKMWNCSRSEAVARLTGKEKLPQHTPKTPVPTQPAEAPKLTATYDYHDEHGQVVYQVLRYEPKTFRQRKMNPDGTTEWSMEGVERVPFNLPAVIATDHIVICEGEKDCLTLKKSAITATCNPGGAKKWLLGFSRFLQGKMVTIIPDNDDPGMEHAKLVLQSLEGRVKWVKIISLPKEFAGKKIKDSTDLYEAIEDKSKFLDELSALEKKAKFYDKGVDCEVFSMVELVHRYVQNAVASEAAMLYLTNWLPGLNVKPLVKGDLLGIMGGTGNLKTATAQNVLQSNPSLSSVIFELELAEDLMVERSVAMATSQHGDDIRGKILANSVNWRKTNRLNNLYICLKSNVSMEYVDQMLERSSSKIGKVPDVFCIDYIQLVRGPGSRYERVSDAAEQAKVLAKKWGCVGIILSQIKRGDSKDKKQGDQKTREVSLEDGKESGSIENSCGLVIGVWKDSANTMKCRVLKNTRGFSGKTVSMKIESGLRIVEVPQDTPKQSRFSDPSPSF